MENALLLPLWFALGQHLDLVFVQEGLAPGDLFLAYLDKLCIKTLPARVGRLCFHGASSDMQGSAFTVARRPCATVAAFLLLRDILEELAQATSETVLNQWRGSDLPNHQHSIKGVGQTSGARAFCEQPERKPLTSWACFHTSLLHLRGHPQCRAVFLQVARCPSRPASCHADHGTWRFRRIGFERTRRVAHWANWEDCLQSGTRWRGVDHHADQSAHPHRAVTLQSSLFRSLRLPLPSSRRFCWCGCLLDSRGHHSATWSRIGSLVERWLFCP